MSDNSPISKLIDQACGLSSPSGVVKRREITPDEKRAVADLAADVIHHIDEMYPAMWKGVPKTARTSLRNTVINAVTALIASYPSQSS